MFTFSDYLKLSRRTKSLATRCMVTYVKMQTGAKTAYQIPKLLSGNKGNRKLKKGWLNASSRFWNRKQNGIPITRQDNFDHVCGLIPGAENILCHPIWYLIDESDLEKDKPTRILSSLPAYYQSVYFKKSRESAFPVRNRVLGKSQRRKITKKNNLNSLLCLLISCLEYQNPDSWNEIDFNQLETVKTFVRLSINNILSDIYQDFFEHFHDVHGLLFYVNGSGDPFIRQQDIDSTWIVVPLSFVQEDHDYTIVEKCRELYQGITDQVIKMGLIGDSERERNALMYSIMHTEIEDLQIELFKLDRKKAHPHQCYCDKTISYAKSILNDKTINLEFTPGTCFN